MADLHPTFSIVIPTFNRPDPLANLLTALGRLDYPTTRCQIVIVNDGGRLDRSRLEQVECRFPLEIVSQLNAGPAAARNTGAARAEGTFLAFTDDDCAPAADWLTALARTLESDGQAGAGGKTINRLERNVYSRASQLLLDYVYEYHNPRAGSATFFASNNLAVPVAGFREIGGFDRAFPRSAGEDRDFCARWTESGRALLYQPEAVMYHAHSLTLRGFSRQHYQYGCGAFSFHSAREQRGAGGLKPDPAFYRDLMLYPFRKTRFPGACALSSLFLLSQAATIVGFHRERRANARRTRGA